MNLRSIKRIWGLYAALDEARFLCKVTNGLARANGTEFKMGISVHPDGDKLTFYVQKNQLELWVLDGIEL